MFFQNNKNAQQLKSFFEKAKTEIKEYPEEEQALLMTIITERETLLNKSANNSKSSNNKLKDANIVTNGLFNDVNIFFHALKTLPSPASVNWDIVPQELGEPANKGAHKVVTDFQKKHNLSSWEDFLMKLNTLQSARAQVQHEQAQAEIEALAKKVAETKARAKEEIKSLSDAKAEANLQALAQIAALQKELEDAKKEKELDFQWSTTFYPSLFEQLNKYKVSADGVVSGLFHTRKIDSLIVELVKKNTLFQPVSESPKAVLAEKEAAFQEMIILIGDVLATIEESDSSYLRTCLSIAINEIVEKIPSLKETLKGIKPENLRPSPTTDDILLNTFKVYAKTLKRAKEAEENAKNAASSEGSSSGVQENETGIAADSDDEVYQAFINEAKLSPRLR